MYLIHDMTGLGADFDVLDIIIIEDKVYAVLMPSTDGDALVCSQLMEDICCEESDRSARDVCILEMREEKDGQTAYYRVEDEMLQTVFEIFRKRNEKRFHFQ